MKRIFTLIITLLLTLTLISCDDSISNNFTTKSDSNGSKKSNKEAQETTEAIIYHTIAFETNGGTNIRSEKTDEIRSAPTTTKDGYVFDGWYLDKSLTSAVIFPLQVKQDMTIYAKWVQIESQINCTGCKIKWDSDYSEAKYYDVTPSGFDTERLQQLGYRKIIVTVYYNVKYEKDYNILWDIGYAGSPKYEISLTNSDDIGQFEEDLSTSTSYRTRTISQQIMISNIGNDKLTLKVSTNNIQNIIYFDNIIVTYQCSK